MFLAFSPVLLLDFQESWEDIKQWTTLPRKQCKYSAWRSCRTCWFDVGAGSPCSSHGWFPVTLWQETWGLRLTEESMANCSRFPLTATVPSLHTPSVTVRSTDTAHCLQMRGFWTCRVGDWPCLVESTPVNALLVGFPQIFEFFLDSRAPWNQRCFFLLLL